MLDLGLDQRSPIGGELKPPVRHIRRLPVLSNIRIDLNLRDHRPVGSAPHDDAGWGIVSDQRAVGGHRDPAS